MTSSISTCSKYKRLAYTEWLAGHETWCPGQTWIKED